ncbi:hypothetical protein PCE1_000330 [Barthelona sp. PCE]
MEYTGREPGPAMDKSFLVKPHLDSFNYFLQTGLRQVVNNLDHAYIEPKDGPTAEVWVDEIHLGEPQKQIDGEAHKIYPRECRERKTTYAAPISIKLTIQESSGTHIPQTVSAGMLPIMVKSNYCHLRDMTPEQLVDIGEEENDFGGIFVVKGLERLVRLIITNRRNNPMPIVRNAFTKRGNEYTNRGILMRCIDASDETSSTNVIHLLKTGNCSLRIAVDRIEYFLPIAVVLRALKSTSDFEIFEKVLRKDDDTFIAESLELLLSQAHSLKIFTSEQALEWLGSKFFHLLPISKSTSLQEAGRYIINKYVFIHLKDYTEKFNLLCHLVRQVYLFSQNRIQPSRIDALSNHELMLPGHVIMQLVKEQLSMFVTRIKQLGESSFARKGEFDWPRIIRGAPADIGARITYFLSTGNTKSQSGLDLPQQSGFTIIAERLNFLRYASHFRSVHRGAFFTEMKTTASRKLLPESWGYLCPVHTPDGGLCGLLNHMSRECFITQGRFDRQRIISILHSFGLSGLASVPSGNTHIAVLLDGGVVGYIAKDEAAYYSSRLRLLKNLKSGLPDTLEIAVTPTEMLIFSTPARFMRPVINLKSKKTEFIGSKEQVWMNIALDEKSIEPYTTHVEADVLDIINEVAQLTPFSDHNQSPRNMYQCQMGKQSMGLPAYDMQSRYDSKMYVLNNMQHPLVRTKEYNFLEDYPLGCNVVVAVLAYTGYSMEDACIINKSSFERGLFNGWVYTTLDVELRDDEYFNNLSLGGKLIKRGIDADGMPAIGVMLEKGDCICVSQDVTTNKARVHKYKKLEPGRVEQVTWVSERHVRIKLRLDRSPIIGDKFSSRHGQKGVCSVFWPSTDMPYAANGIVPDLIINPHAFPSRMTIGMLIEMLAAKGGAINGVINDATPFTYDEDTPAYEYFGEMLSECGYSYYGTESLMSGIFGEEMETRIYMAPCYYQRLRHMIRDKYQVRATGRINPVTRQPVKGRKMGGGIRCGEMERDALIAHGGAYIVRERLMNVSDASEIKCCSKCGSMLTLSLKDEKTFCRVCEEQTMVSLKLPYVFYYLVNELASTGINLKLNLKDRFK